MGLRTKALLAAAALVAAVTGALTHFVTRRYEEAERARIGIDLRRDADRLREIFEETRLRTESALRPALAAPGLIRLLAAGNAAGKEAPEEEPPQEDAPGEAPPEEGIKEGLDPFAEEWGRLSEATLAVAALETFVAGDRKATVRAEGTTLAVCGLWIVPPPAPDSPPALTPERLPALLDAGLRKLLDDAFAGRSSRLGILAAEGRAWSAVAMPFSETLQERIEEAEPVGAAAVLVELSDGWVSERLSSGAGAARIGKAIVVDGAVSASSPSDRPTGMRILTALQGAGRVETEIDGERQIALSTDLGTMGMGRGISLLAWRSLDAALADLRELRRRIFAAGLVLASAGAFAAYASAFLYIKRLDRIREATVRVREGDFEAKVEPKGGDEIATLSRAFNDMTSGLRALGLYTDPALAKSVLESGRFLTDAGRRVEGTVLFSDVKDFTTISEAMAPDALVSQLNEYLGRMSDPVKAERGYLDKFIGDAVMAYWGPPFLAGGDPARRACRAAATSIGAAAELSARWRSEGKPLFFTRVGIATGPLVVGNIGSESKKSYTVIGDTVNLASRLEGANKLYGTRILAEERTVAAASDELLFREVDQIRLKGKRTPVRVYELAGLAGRFPPGRRAAMKAYADALARYRARDFAGALERIEEALRLDPGDGPSLWLAARCRDLSASPPPEGWEPVTTATEK